MTKVVKAPNTDRETWAEFIEQKDRVFINYGNFGIK